MQVTAIFTVQTMYKSIETDMPSFSPLVTRSMPAQVNIDPELADSVDKYLAARESHQLVSPAYGANPLFVNQLRKKLAKVFTGDTKVSKMSDDDVVDSAITNAVEDYLESIVPSNASGAKELGVDTDAACPDGFYVANVFVKLKGWKVSDGER